MTATLIEMVTARGSSAPSCATVSPPAPAATARWTERMMTMKIDPKDMQPLMKKDKRGGVVDPDSIESRCKAAGVKTNPNTIRSRMKRMDISFEEAVAYVPPTRSEVGRKAKKHSRWGKDIPASSEEYQLRQGRKPFPQREK